ncbi:SIMPL domain-containing protein [Azorhizobium oxalatiphilum]|uniref:SIMPL domain-containing protein n=1 Tax=Azorhizobium oxalatiphilum TaxID=980631 RepID=A0A917CEF5_9HYPH|nr:SIMPL domain-containing protein [Azorhizobium oxalatiphilum]GGF82651.1 SIMPL domain-containing protein [Azorhizobium oxalatiphilum]
MRMVANWSKVAMAGVLAAGLGTGLSTGVASAQEMNRATLSVVGQGRVSARPDLAVLTTGVVVQGKTAEEALAANSKAMEQVIAAIKEIGIEPKDIMTSGFGVSPQYSQPGRDSREAPKLVGYEVRNGVTVKVRDLVVLGALLDKVVQAGANQASGLSFQMADSAPMQSQARIEAVKDAMAQAVQVAEAAGVRLVRIRRIEPRGEGAPYLPAPAPMLMKAEARAVPIEAGETEARASVSVVYEIEPR